jgi:hypothetical protein
VALTVHRVRSGFNFERGQGAKGIEMAHANAEDLVKRTYIDAVLEDVGGSHLMLAKASSSYTVDLTF